jgi:hypothetical protein
VVPVTSFIIGEAETVMYTSASSASLLYGFGSLKFMANPAFPVFIPVNLS